MKRPVTSDKVLEALPKKPKILKLKCMSFRQISRNCNDQRTVVRHLHCERALQAVTGKERS